MATFTGMKKAEDTAILRWRLLTPRCCAIRSDAASTTYAVWHGKAMNAQTSRHADDADAFAAAASLSTLLMFSLIALSHADTVSPPPRSCYASARYCHAAVDPCCRYGAASAAALIDIRHTLMPRFSPAPRCRCRR